MEDMFRPLRRAASVMPGTHLSEDERERMRRFFDQVSRQHRSTRSGMTRRANPSTVLYRQEQAKARPATLTPASPTAFARWAPRFPRG